MKPITLNRRAASGFSLLEVLVAVVVLATGLLALAALQASLARNSADAKVRSRIATLISNQIDGFRAGGYDALAPTAGTTIVADPAADCSDTAVLDAIDAAACEGAVSGLQLTTKVTEFSKSGAGFAAGAPASPSDAQFKLVKVTASWTDAAGADRSIEQSTVFSALALQANSPLVSKQPSGFDQSSPKVREKTPFEEGMIPIAIGNGSETAATNPKPVVVGTNNTLAETKYNVYTYDPGGSDGTLIQRRVETTVIGCRCDTAAATSLGPVFGQNFRPTYWNGKRYATPEMLDTSIRPAPAGPADGVAQSDLCTDCCRDHHDQSSDEIKFDPFRSGSHSHYVRSGATLTQAASGVYEESCRLIRVDGLWRVATDSRVEHVGFVATGPGMTDQAPDPGKAEKYEAFVRDSLKSQFVAADGKTVAERYDDPLRLLNDSPVDEVAGDDSDNRIGIDAALDSKRYLNTRALMIDHIENDAQDAIDNALENCENTDKVDCVLSHIPFTAINVTELARYGVTKGNVIGVVDGGINFNDETIEQGQVSGRSTAANNDEASAFVNFRLSNSAVAAIDAIDPDDETSWRPDAGASSSDAQPYVAKSSGSFTGDPFTVQLNGPDNLEDNTQTNDPGVRWRLGIAGYPYPCGATSQNGTPIPARCQTDQVLASGTRIDLVVSGYNYFTGILKTDPNYNVTVQCTNAATNGGNGFASIGNHAQGRLCRRYRVVGATINDATGRSASGFAVTANEGSAKTGGSEETTISFDGTASHFIGANDPVVVTFEHAEDVLPGAPVCTYNGNGTTVASATWTSDCDE